MRLLPSVLCCPVSPSISVFCSAAPRDPRSTDSAETMTLPGSPVGRHLLKKPHPFVNVTGAKPTIKKSPSGFGGPIPKRPLLSGAPAGCSSKARQGGPVSRPRARDLEMLEAKRRPVVTSGPMASAAPGHLMASGAAWSPPESQICQSTRRCLQKRLRERWAVRLHSAVDRGLPFTTAPLYKPQDCRCLADVALFPLPSESVTVET